MTAWQLTPNSPLALQLGADARLSQTDYFDDQVWELIPGSQGNPALALQTSYGGRVGLASIIPLWRIDNRPVYQYQAYTSPPVITAFAPGYLQSTAKNTGAALELGFDLVGFAAAQGQEMKLAPLPLTAGVQPLAFGKLGNLNP